MTTFSQVSLKRKLSTPPATMTGVPGPVTYESQVFSVAFHPDADIVAAGTIEGFVHCHRYAPDSPPVQVWSSKLHKSSCRALDFASDGSVLYSGSKDRTLQVVNIETGSATLKKSKAHAEPINALLTLSDALVATGDDGGCVKIWDLRQRKVALSYHENTDFISDLHYVDHKKTLLATSGDGHLSIFDIRKKKPVAVSEQQDDELLCVTVVRNTTKAVVGTQDGNLLLFSWGDWGDCTDRFPGHPSSVDSILRIEDETVMTASGDGILRAIGILPNKLIGAVGEHGDMPIESIRLARDGELVGSCSHDATVRFWSVAASIKDDDSDDVENAETLENAEMIPDAEAQTEDDSSAEPDFDTTLSVKSQDSPLDSGETKGSKLNTGLKKRASSLASETDSSDSDQPVKKDKRKKKPKKAKKGIGSGKRANASFFADIS
ncbi:WD domain repeat-containing protein 55 [Geranomyces michiganensis]|nr:WD domain repeat-containing protein 55 [Geranomyces michiganensis]